MIFNELYSAYYLTVTKLIHCCLEKGLDEKSALKIIQETAFAESTIPILDAIKTEQWQILTKDFQTNLRHKPQMPLTLLEKRWLKTISLDERFSLFCDSLEGLENIEPLYTMEDIKQPDKKQFGDPYTQQNYRENFKTVLQALKQHKQLCITYQNRKGKELSGNFSPYKLEYSQKDDKFRLLTWGASCHFTINLARIVTCNLGEAFSSKQFHSFRRKKSMVSFFLTDERNALDRAMRHFANYEKQTEQVAPNQYQIKLYYPSDDETEVIIRILSFGPMITVIAPQKMMYLIKQRLIKQKTLCAKHL